MRALFTAILILFAASLAACASMEGRGGPQLGAEPVRVFVQGGGVGARVVRG